MMTLKMNRESWKRQEKLIKTRYNVFDWKIE